VIHPVAGQQSGDDREGLLEPVDPLARAVERDPRRAVFGLVPARPDAELETAARQVMQAAASCATIAGCRKSLESTSVPTCRRDVTAAAAASAPKGASCWPNAPAEK
jgi:hypothetical protein